MIVPVILAGGSGTRLWPLSRELFPKQLINLTGEKTMLQNTLLRLENYEGICDPIILCNDNHRFMVAEQLRLTGVKPASIILEPVGRNTAPALAVAAIKAVEDGDDPVLLVLPADHTIGDVDAFHASLKKGSALAEKGYLITFGIVPDTPETGYGYIKKGRPAPGCDSSGLETGMEEPEAVFLEKFVEKPNHSTAVKYLESGNYCWNSGMFMFRASKVLEELQKFTPEIVSKCRLAMENGKGDLDFFRLERDSFSESPEDSIDYAIMEKTEDAVMVELKADWNDLGSFEALWQVGEKDLDGNVSRGDILIHDVKNSYLHAGSRLIAAVGLENHIVVETSDAVMISPRNRVQEVKSLVEKLRKEKREEAVSHKKVYRPWGSYEGVDSSERFQVKRITVNSGEVLSLQKHYHRAEHWVVVSGTALVTKGEETLLLKEDESVYIPLGETHRLENPGKIPLDLIEVQSGSYLGEDDIVRMEDLYGR